MRGNQSENQLPRIFCLHSDCVRSQQEKAKLEEFILPLGKFYGHPSIQQPFVKETPKW